MAGASTNADFGGASNPTETVITERHPALQGETPQEVSGFTSDEIYGAADNLRVMAEGDPQPAWWLNYVVHQLDIRSAKFLLNLAEPLLQLH